ncbi:PDZ domain-containing protein [Kushneria phosphatilytica]|uniref:Uncharacterized protein n=1 Tax=Kushneria phosphatilytica TaxID=657387 RepID=A0A1S1NMI9_9GAMM|nr:PDZ domain-containing protein [Kushneria phosphatilytica]OHV08400.1 hypothetical protein BH688_13920 [Kushneria phosphatilytica]QEL09826.1 hypothetical protein FY550_00890 [Kushneria phosphatilytica]
MIHEMLFAVFLLAQQPPVDSLTRMLSSNDEHFSMRSDDFLADTPQGAPRPPPARPSTESTAAQNKTQTVSSSPLPEDAPVDFEFTGTTKQGMTSRTTYPVRIRGRNDRIYIDYPAWQCGGTASVLREKHGQIQLQEQILYGRCKGGYISLKQVRANRWDFRWSNVPGGPDWRKGRLTLRQNSRAKPRLMLASSPPAESEILRDERTGLSLAKGPGRRGFGPTSLVTGVTPGSSAHGAGVRQKDLILMVDQAAADPAGHLSLIHRGFSRGNTVRVLLEHPDGEQSMVRLVPPARTASGAEVTVRDAARVKEVLSRESGRFDQKRPALPQLIALADALGIPEDGISEAIANGHLNPHPDDLFNAYFELDDSDCQAMQHRIQQRLTGEGKSRNVEAIASMDCKRASLLFDKVRYDAWNHRFGAKPETLELRPVDPSFPAHLQPKRINPTVLSHFNLTHETQKQYAQMRCDFTTALFEHDKAFIDCDGVRSTRENNTMLAQARAAQRDETFGPTDNAISYRLGLMANGAFEMLETLAIEDMLSLHAEEKVSRIGRYDPAGPEPRFTPLIAGYAKARIWRHGACGETTTNITKVVMKRIQTKTLSGLIIGEQDNSYRMTFEAPARFARVIRQYIDNPLPGELGWARVAKRFQPALDKIDCQSEARQRLEDNMIAYLSGQPPVHRR